jgi:hypothetical protein
MCICHVLGTENPHDATEPERHSPKVSLWCALMTSKITGLFIFEESVVTDDSFLVMMKDTALRRVSVGTILQFSRRFPTFLESFLIIG